MTTDIQSAIAAAYADAAKIVDQCAEMWRQAGMTVSAGALSAASGDIFDRAKIVAANPALILSAPRGYHK